ncbi:MULTISPECIES: hypothetical protein [unclassified Vibrio]|uniref:hypothetical protein n=1 Tax=unclassified Vibrio TaxID=2614977 RepID=UPI001360F683|nr:MULTISPECIES: hypothetical protein [unclassified Vibrio]NAW58743.1 hypothetical protein [Vibrio sp. V36_P2S2PM302]NAX27176.1 hypothetical protein [Vibrio sp. V38_P2S17PM301]NAX31729.1 hypothetical protein [Vibrio sp. V37_P2S8PM304]
MQYVAIRLFGDGAMKRHKFTLEPETTSLGEFDSMAEAIEQACEQLSCNHVRHGILSEGEGLGGFMVVDTQELTSI